MDDLNLLLERYEEKNGTTVWSKNYRGISSALEKDFESAEKYFLEALEIEKNTEILFNLGVVNIAGAYYKKAEEYLREALRESEKSDDGPEIRGRVSIQLGIVNYLNGNNEEAEKYLNKGLILTPDNLEGMLFRKMLEDENKKPMIRLKNEKQINGIRKSCRMLAKVYREIEKKVIPGITTGELNDIAADLIFSGGGKPAFLNYNGYPASLCTSVNSVVIHGIPGSRKLKQGDIVSLDLGIDLNGYLSDSAYTFPVGKISSEAERLIRVTRECLEKGIEKAVAGNRVKDISKAVYSHALSNGYGVVREFCGHGVGLELHEEPQIPNYVGRGPNPRLKPGMVIAIEPMINQGDDDIFIHDDDWTVETVDGLLSAHFEHTIAIFHDHTEILTV